MRVKGKSHNILSKIAAFCVYCIYNTHNNNGDLHSTNIPQLNLSSIVSTQYTLQMRVTGVKSHNIQSKIAAVCVYCVYNIHNNNSNSTNIPQLNLSISRRYRYPSKYCRYDIVALLYTLHYTIHQCIVLKETKSSPSAHCSVTQSNYTLYSPRAITRA